MSSHVITTETKPVLTKQDSRVLQRGCRCIRGLSDYFFKPLQKFSMRASPFSIFAMLVA